MNGYTKIGATLLVGGLLTLIGSSFSPLFIAPKETPTIKLYHATQQLDEALNNPLYKGLKGTLETVVAEVKTELETLNNTKDVEYYIKQTQKCKNLGNYGFFGSVPLVISGALLMMRGARKEE